MWASAYIRTNGNLMGHHENAMNMSCDIWWKQTIPHTVTCFVSHYTNDFSFQRMEILPSLRLKITSTYSHFIVMREASICHLSLFTVKSIFFPLCRPNKISAINIQTTFICWCGVQQCSKNWKQANLRYGPAYHYVLLIVQQWGVCVCFFLVSHFS